MTATPLCFRPASIDEARILWPEFLEYPNGEGLVCEHGGAIVGFVAWFVSQGKFFVHSLYAADSGPCGSRLMLKARDAARSKGFSALSFTVSPELPALQEIAGSRGRLIYSLYEVNI